MCLQFDESWDHLMLFTYWQSHAALAVAATTFGLVNNLCVAKTRSQSQRRYMTVNFRRM